MALAAVVGTAMAEPPSRGDRPEGERRGPMRGFFEKADADGDGVVTRAEFDALDRVGEVPTEVRDGIFSRLDKDGDGVIRPDELRGARPGGPGGPGPLPKLRELDTNQDGQIDFDEFQAGEIVSKMPEERRRMVFDRLDRNGDGVLSPLDRPERPPHIDGDGPGGRRGPRGEGGPPPFELLDEDGDGSVTFDEFQKAPPHRHLSEDQQEDRFERLDRNGDQRLTPDEGRPKKEGE